MSTELNTIYLPRVGGQVVDIVSALATKITAKLDATL